MPTRPLSKAEKRIQRRAEKAAAQPGANALVAKTRNQELLIDHIKSGRSVFATGGAGTGKTYIPSRMAARALIEGRVERIIIARPAVSKAKHALGYRPGNTDAKMAEWMTPIIEALRKEASGTTIDKWKDSGQLVIVPFETMRGRTFDDAFIILDEAQNCDYADLRMFLTRTGEAAQMVVTGDTDQIDVHGSGLAEVCDLIFDYDLPVEMVAFTEEDCVRSPMARAFVIAFKKADEKKKALAEAKRRAAEAREAGLPEPEEVHAPAFLRPIETAVAA